MAQGEGQMGNVGLANLAQEVHMTRKAERKLTDEELEQVSGGLPECINITTGEGASFTNCSGDGNEPPPRVTVDGTVITRG